jgi:hypothetical protein
MSRAKVAKTQQDFEGEAILNFEKEHDGPFRMEELAAELIANGWEVKVPTREAILTRRLKRRARELREVDAQKRKVRSIIAAKIMKPGPDGEMVTEVQYDHIHGMTWTHALTAFKQRCDNHTRQNNALDRDIGSFNDNNPNARDHKITKQMLLSFEGEAAQLVETIKESDAAKRITQAKPK